MKVSTLFLALSATALPGLARPFTPADLIQSNRISAGSVSLSESSTHLAYLQSHYSISKHLQTTQLVIQSLKDGKQRAVLQHTKDSRLNPPDAASEKSELKPSEPVWLDDQTLLFASTTDGKSTLYTIKQDADGWSKPQVYQELPLPISGLQVHKDSSLSFTAQVYSNTTAPQETADRDQREAATRADSGQIYDELWARHWDVWMTPKTSQLFSCDIKATNCVNLIGPPTSKTERDLEVGSYVYSPDGKQMAFVAKYPSLHEYSWKTTSYVYLVKTGQQGATPINDKDTVYRGASASPSFNGDGSKIAYLQIISDHYESGRKQIRIYDQKSKKTTEVAKDWDRSPQQLGWLDDKTLLVTYNEHGRNKMSQIDIESGKVTPILTEHAVGSIHKVLEDNQILFDYSALDAPTDLYTVTAEDKQIKQLTHSNPDFGKTVELSQPEDLQFQGANNATIHGYMLKPPQFDSEKKYPLAFLIHGGPQGTWLDSWSTRWNPNVFAAAGFVTVFLDPQGSLGYGQEFTDSITNQWGGLPYQSLMESLDQLLDQCQYIDSDRMAALGASYGGYMINWINGQTDRFKALVNHDGTFGNIGFYYGTDELYFPEHDFGGTAFNETSKETYEKWSPEEFVKNWKTPTLVIHGELDYRLPITEGLSTFTALRRQDVPARLLYFPDENHHVVKPANSLKWHHEVLGWIKKWTQSK